MNPMALMKLKERLGIFQKQHPRVLPFLRSVQKNALQPGTVVELTITTPDGAEKTANIKMTEDDVETIRMLLKEK